MRAQLMTLAACLFLGGCFRELPPPQRVAIGNVTAPKSDVIDIVRTAALERLLERNAAKYVTLVDDKAKPDLLIDISVSYGQGGSSEAESGFFHGSSAKGVNSGSFVNAVSCTAHTPEGAIYAVASFGQRIKSGEVLRPPNECAYNAVDRLLDAIGSKAKAK